MLWGTLPRIFHPTPMRVISWRAGDPTVISMATGGASVINRPWDTSFIQDGNVGTGALDNVSVSTSTFGGVGPDFPIAELTFTAANDLGSTVIDLKDALVGWFAPGAVPIPCGRKISPY